MSILVIDPQNPEDDRIQQVASLLARGEMIIFPTDAGYVLGCDVSQRKAVKRLVALRGETCSVPFLSCLDTSMLSAYTTGLSGAVFRLLKLITGSHHLLLEATSSVPRVALHPEEKTIHFHLSNHPVCRAIVQALGRPLLGLPLLPAVAVDAAHDPYTHHAEWGQHVGLTVHAGDMVAEQPTLLDLTSGEARLVRQGKGDTSFLN